MSDPSRHAVGRGTPLVSVVIPTHNCGAYLVQAVESVLAQTVRDLEIIVVDDGSTDDTAARVERFGGAIEYLRQDRRGQAAARNAGIARARGTYVAFLDADDLWEPEKLEVQLPLAQAVRDVGLVFSDCCFFDERGMVHPSWIARRSRFVPGQHLRPGGTWVGRPLPGLLLQNFIATPTVLIARECLARVGGFDESYTTGEDHHLWVRVAARFDLGYVHRPLVRVRVRPESLINRKDFRPMYRNEIRVVRESLAALGRIDLRTRLLWRRRLADLHLRLAWRLLNGGAIGEAREELERSIRHWPLQARPYLFWAGTRLPSGVFQNLRGWREGLRSLWQVALVLGAAAIDH